MATRTKAALIFLLATLLCVSHLPAGAEAQLLAKITATGNYTTVVKLLTTTKMTNMFDASAPVTVFLTSDAVFNKALAPYPKSITDCLYNTPAGQAVLGSLVKYNIVAGNYSYSQLLNTTSLPTLYGANITFVLKNDSKLYFSDGDTVSDTYISSPDMIQDPQGIVHGISGVIMPSDAIGKLASCASTPGGGSTPAAAAPTTTKAPTPSSAPRLTAPITGFTQYFTAFAALLSAFLFLQSLN